MFCDRFLELPVIIMYINDKEGDMHPNEEYENAIEMILPLEISSYLADGELTNIYMKNGRVITTTLDFNAFQKLANEHMEGQIKK